MIDPTTGWFEIVEAANKLFISIQDLFHNTWLAHYLAPQFILFERESTGKFKYEFKQMCNNHGIISCQLLMDILRAFDLEKESLDEDNPFDYFLQ
jgi:hypothetical protein